MISDSISYSSCEAPKDFCLGMHKTGTTSLLHSFLRLGIRTCDGLAGASQAERLDFARADNKFNYLQALIAQFQAFEDVPWPLFYKELYELYPEARFILTTRDPQLWIHSCVSHFGNKPDPVHEWIYGPGCATPLGHEAVWVNKFVVHNHSVLNFFAQKPQSRFIHIEIDNNEKSKFVSDRLRGFLAYPQGPDIWVGKSNSQFSRNSLFNVGVRRLRQLKYRLVGTKSISVLGIRLTQDYSPFMNLSSTTESTKEF